MGVQFKAVFAAGVVLIAFVFGSPAEAEPLVDQRQEDFTFTRQGQQLTCTVVATSAYEVVAHIEDQFVMTFRGSTALSDSDPACHDAFRKIAVQVEWFRRDGAQIGLLSAASGSEIVEASTGVVQSSAAMRVSAVHTIAFECDGRPCFFGFGTQPK